MATLAEIRQQYPQYSDMSDVALADALYGKFYSDMPRQDFDAKIGLPLQTELIGTTPASGDHPARVVIGTNPQPDISTATAIGRGAAQGLTLGGYDELRGLAEAGGVKPDEPASLGALIRGSFNLLTGSGDEGYKAGSERSRAEFKTAEEQHPAATMGGEIGGALGGIGDAIGGALGGGKGDANDDKDKKGKDKSD